MILSYGVRCIAGLGFIFITKPDEALVTWTVVAFVLSSNFEEVCINSLFSKRLPGDVRAAMIALQTFFGKLGHFFFAAIALLTLNKYGMQAGMVAVSICDFSIVVISVIVSLTKGFKEDPAAGEEAKKQG